MVGLTSAADATAGAGHDLDGVELFLAFAHSFEEFAGVGQTVGNADVDGRTVEVNPSVADAFHATEFGEIDLFEGLAGEHFVGGTGGGFNHTTSGTEDDASTRGFAQRVVVILKRHILQVEVELFDQASQLTGRKDVVDVGVVAHIEFLTLAFVLLGQARHDGDDDEVFPLDAHLLGPVGLGDSAKHLHGRLGG